MKDRYTSIKASNRDCEGERFGPNGFRQRCEDKPVFKIHHANGQTLHICEYHVECYWNFWPTFREAIRDIWPVRQGARLRSDPTVHTLR